LIASDGVWEKLPVNEAGVFLQGSFQAAQDPKVAATALVENARARWTGDNVDDITAVVVCAVAFSSFTPQVMPGVSSDNPPQLTLPSVILEDAPGQESKAAITMDGDPSPSVGTLLASDAGWPSPTVTAEPSPMDIDAAARFRSISGDPGLLPDMSKDVDVLLLSSREAPPRQSSPDLEPEATPEATPESPRAPAPEVPPEVPVEAPVEAPLLISSGSAATLAAKAANALGSGQPLSSPLLATSAPPPRSEVGWGTNWREVTPTGAKSYVVLQPYGGQTLPSTAVAPCGAAPVLVKSPNTASLAAVAMANVSAPMAVGIGTTLVRSQGSFGEAAGVYTPGAALDTPRGYSSGSNVTVMASSGVMAGRPVRQAPPPRHIPGRGMGDVRQRWMVTGTETPP